MGGVAKDALDPSTWCLYVITDSSLSRGKTHGDVVEKALRGGADAIQVREKEAGAMELLSLSRDLKVITGKYGRPLLVNDRIDVTILAGAQGVHIGFDDFDYGEGRKLVAPPLILGTSAGNREEVEEALRAGPDYIGLGPIFEARDTKSDAGKPVGLEFLEKIRKMTDIPIIAIGGINQENAHSVIAAGASGVAVISSVVGASDIELSARKLKERVLEARDRYRA